MAEFGKVGPAHLRREAWVYVRQSTMTQVRQHTESLARQYELAERAQALGWRADQVRVVDSDLGRSGAEATARAGFQSLVAAVGLGGVGVVFGIEVSRLARCNADWYHLLDLCAITDTLIADADGVYHPAEYNDRLVLGLKGTMSEAELHLLRSRLDAGLRHKAARGELRQPLPVGLDHDEDGRMVLSPDEAVVGAIRVVFDRFAELGSARQVLMSLRGDGLRLPRRPVGSRRVRWEEATYPALHDLLTNPAYAGAYVFGRTKRSRRLDETGRVVTTTRELPVDQWEVCLPGHHPGYIDWDTYLANRARLRSNWRSPAGEGGGAAREGRALLQGLVRCERCGRRMQVGYSTGARPRYLCARALQLYGAGRRCQSVGGRSLEAAVLTEVFSVLEPAAMTATAQALAESEHHHRQRLTVFELAVERARFEAERARRQFDACEPENRLVARNLERAWEERLVVLRHAEADLATQQARRPPRLSDEELAWLSRAGADLRAVFDADTTTIRERKLLLRALIADVVVNVDRPAGVARGRICWEGGATTEITFALPKRGDSALTTDEETVEAVRRLAAHYDDATIARHLGRRSRVTATGLPFTKERVASLRRTRGIPGPQSPGNVTPPGDDAQVVTITQAQGILGVSRATLHRWIADGFIPAEQDTPGGPRRVRIDAALRAKLVPELPPGWVGLAQAAQTLGVARQTVLDRIRRGELDAVAVTRGRRTGLAIRVPPPQDDLFSSQP
jgi:DNA invertase Pin-like site-specific DNA recombinase/predicted DNA-binding transcriptional regulator AlpA